MLIHVDDDDDACHCIDKRSSLSTAPSCGAPRPALRGGPARKTKTMTKTAGDKAAKGSKQRKTKDPGARIHKHAVANHSHDPKIQEQAKNALFIKGRKSGQILDSILNDLVCKQCQIIHLSHLQSFHISHFTIHNHNCFNCLNSLNATILMRRSTC